jgi:hypothetical protein
VKAVEILGVRLAGGIAVRVVRKTGVRIVVRPEVRGAVRTADRMFKRIA